MLDSTAHGPIPDTTQQKSRHLSVTRANRTNCTQQLQGWHKYKETDMEGILSMMDVVVLNYALHYNPENGQTFVRPQHSLRCNPAPIA